MAQKKRVEEIQCFQSSQTGFPAIMLLFLKAGRVGLNLMVPSQVFLMDPGSNGLFVMIWLNLGEAPLVFSQEVEE